MELLLNKNSLLNFDDVTMMHYKQDRSSEEDPWEKEPKKSLNAIFNTIVRKQLINVVRNDLEADKAQNHSFYKDGEVKQFYGNRYERKLKNRIKAIEIHGTKCIVCNFDFKEVYGDHGKDFIEIHHLRPLNTLETAMEINPSTDLVPVYSYASIYKLAHISIYFSELMKHVH